jgi:glycosyltransferase involved in cell wall biosynthesis/2-polyprenyl-3-methyl-5-hydroxy-6-metoxy-1,4-benzoquinol methylase
MSANNLHGSAPSKGPTAPPVRVLVIGPTPPPVHGVSVATQTLLRAADDPRLEMLHLDIADRRGIEYVDRPDFHDVYLFCRQWLELAGLLISRRPRVVYLSISQSTIGVIRDGLFIMLARLSGARIVIHLHGGSLPQWFAGRGPLLQAFVRRILHSCSRFIVLAEGFRQPLSALVAAEKIVVVPNGVPAPAGARAPETLSRQDSSCRLLFLSTLSRAKGALVLLDAVRRLTQQGVPVPVQLVLAGPWLRKDDHEMAQDFISEHRLDAVVRLSGPVEGSGKAELLKWADVFVFPGIQQEGQPLVVLEAMAAGLPVVFCDRGCIAETVVDGECGLMVRVGDAEDLAAKISLLATRAGERERMGANARSRYEARFRESQFAANLMAVLLDAGGQRGDTEECAADGQSSTLEYFNRVAERFHDNYSDDDAFKERRSVWERLIRDSLPPLAAGALCMDMGCGDGRLGQTAAAAGVHTVGIDQSGEMLALARARARRLQLEAHTEYLQAALPLPEDLLARYRGQANLILCSSVLEYVGRYEDVLQQFFELLREGGRLIVSVPNARSLYRWGEKLLGRVLPERDSYLKYQQHTFDPRSFRVQAEQLGYSAVHDEFFALPLRLPARALSTGSRQRLATLYVLVAQKPHGSGSLGTRLVA